MFSEVRFITVTQSKLVLNGLSKIKTFNFVHKVTAIGKDGFTSQQAVIAKITASF